MLANGSHQENTASLAFESPSVILKGAPSIKRTEKRGFVKRGELPSTIAIAGLTVIAVALIFTHQPTAAITIAALITPGALQLHKPPSES